MITKNNHEHPYLNAYVTVCTGRTTVEYRSPDIHTLQVRKVHHAQQSIYFLHHKSQWTGKILARR